MAGPANSNSDETDLEQCHLFVDGRWEPAEDGETFTAVAPRTNDPLASVARGSRSDVQRALAAARRVQRDLEELTVFERADLCFEMADAVETNRESLTEWLVRDQGKPRYEAYHEIDDAVRNFRNAGEYNKHDTTEVINSRDPNKRVITVRKPRGVYGVITPWNFPVGNPTEHLAAGLAGGNAIVWVAAPTTSVIAVKLMAAIAETSLPDGAVNLITGEGPVVGNELVVNDEVDAIGFTGSSSTGREIDRAAGPKHVLLELGGNGPIVVLDDADIEAAVECTAVSCFYNAGQACTASERILVHEAVHEEFTRRLVDRADSITVGDPFDEATDMGPLNNSDVVEKMDAHVDDAIEHGAELLTGGARIDDASSPWYYEPTVIDGITQEMVVSREETFGPIAPIGVFSTYDEALEIANQDTYGLTSAVFTSHISSMDYFSDRLESGTVIVNDGSGYWENQLPMGGFSGKRSGYGRRGGGYTIDEMTQLKVIVVDHENVNGPRSRDPTD